MEGAPFVAQCCSHGTVWLKYKRWGEPVYFGFRPMFTAARFAAPFVSSAASDLISNGCTAPRRNGIALSSVHLSACLDYFEVQVPSTSKSFIAYFEIRNRWLMSILIFGLNWLPVRIWFTPLSRLGNGVRDRYAIAHRLERAKTARPLLLRGDAGCNRADIASRPNETFIREMRMRAWKG